MPPRPSGSTSTRRSFHTERSTSGDVGAFVRDQLSGGALSAGEREHLAGAVAESVTAALSNRAGGTAEVRIRIHGQVIEVEVQGRTEVSNEEAGIQSFHQWLSTLLETRSLSQEAAAR